MLNKLFQKRLFIHTNYDIWRVFMIEWHFVCLRFDLVLVPLQYIIGISPPATTLLAWRIVSICELNCRLVCAIVVFVVLVEFLIELLRVDCKMSPISSFTRYHLEPFSFNLLFIYYVCWSVNVKDSFLQLYSISLRTILFSPLHIVYCVFSWIIISNRPQLVL